MNKIALVLATYQANISMLHQALACSDLFDEVVLHINDVVTMSRVQIPKNCKVLYQEERCTVQEALNVGINQATSTYILPWTDDDFFHREALVNLIDYVKYYEGVIDVIRYPIYVGYNNNWKIWGNQQNITLESLSEANTIPFSCVYHKTVWEGIGGYKSGPFSDWYFWLEVLKKNFKFDYWQYPIYCHRQGHKDTLANKEQLVFNKTEFLERLK